MKWWTMFELSPAPALPSDCLKMLSVGSDQLAKDWNQYFFWAQTNSKQRGIVEWRDEKLERSQKIIKVLVSRENTNKLTSSVPRGINRNLTHRDLIVILFVTFPPTFEQKSKNSKSEGGDEIKEEEKMRK